MCYERRDNSMVRISCGRLKTGGIRRSPPCDCTGLLADRSRIGSSYTAIAYAVYTPVNECPLSKTACYHSIHGLIHGDQLEGLTFSTPFSRWLSPPHFFHEDTLLYCQIKSRSLGSGVLLESAEIDIKMPLATIAIKCWVVSRGSVPKIGRRAKQGFAK